MDESACKKRLGCTISLVLNKTNVVHNSAEAESAVEAGMIVKVEEG